VRGGRGACTGAYTVTCNLGPIEHDDSGTVVFTVRPELVGTLLMTAATSTSTAQTSLDDDTFASDVTVLPPTLRLLDLRLSTPVFRTGGRTAIKWYMTDAAAVNVKVEQISRRGRHLSRGSFPVKGRAGSNAVLFKGRVPRHKRLKPGNYRFTVSAATADGRVATPGLLSFTVRHRHRR
jgi:methionine-rich copper-binding protein CopC